MSGTRSELCKTCIHTKVCMHDKNLIGDVFVMGNPICFDNDELYKKYKEREAQGFPCEDYMPTAEPKKGKWVIDDPKRGIWTHIYYCSECGKEVLSCEVDKPNFCSNCGADMRGEEE